MNVGNRGPITGHTYFVCSRHNLDDVMEEVSDALSEAGFEDDPVYVTNKKFRITITVEQV